MHFSKLIMSVIIVALSSNAMELPVVVSSDRRPIEEAMFTIFAEHQERMVGLESTDKELSGRALEHAALNANQRVNGAIAQLTIDQVGRKQSSDLLRAIIENRGSVNEVNQDNQRLRNQLALQAQEISQLRGQMRESKEQQLGAQAELQNHKQVAKWVYIAGGAALVVGGIVIARLALKNGQLHKDVSTLALEQNDLRSQIIELKDRPYVGLNENNEMVIFRRDASGQKTEKHVDTGVAAVRYELSKLKYDNNVNLSQMKNDVDVLKARPYVSKDHNNVLVLHNDPNGGGSVHGTHVKPFKN